MGILCTIPTFLLLQAWTNIPASITAMTLDSSSTLPPRLQQAISKGLLARPRPDLYVLGTVHIGSESAEEAQALIEAVKPSTVVIEIPPSRLKRIRLQNNNDKRTDKPTDVTVSKMSPPSANGMFNALRSLPSLAAAGWSKGGVAGLLFATVIVGPSLLKRSTTASEEKSTLPRRNEFTAAIEAADELGSTVIPADLEFDELISAVTQSVSPLGWVELGMNVLGETAGIRPVDPIKRLRDESIVEWADRRRDVYISRASKVHGDRTAPGLSRALVDDRDVRFTEACLKVLNANDAESSEQDQNGQSSATVCIVGLVHLDGVVDRLQVLQ